MNRKRRDDDDPDSTGFVFTRRAVLTGAAGASAGLAGCNFLDQLDDSTTTEAEPGPGPGTGTPTETATATPTAAPAEQVEDLTSDALELVNSELVEGPNGYRTYLRVTVRNTLEDPISVVTLSAEFYDSDLAFLETQTATIASLRANEVFDGYISYVTNDSAAYAVRADHSERDGRQQAVSGVSVVDDCLDQDRVTGTVENENNGTVPRLSVQATFFNGDGEAMETAQTTITDLGESEQAPFEIEAAEVFEHGTVDIADYSVSIGEYGGPTFAVR